MTLFDYTVLAILALSVLIGIARGFVREVFALAGWIAAAAVAILFGAQAATLLPASFSTPVVRTTIACVVLFLGVLILSGVTGAITARLLRAAGLGMADRTLGAMFGVARGALIILAAVLLAGLTALPTEPFWRQAKLAPPLETAAIAVKPYLPRSVAERVRYGRAEH
jgi:membrane protein required for colicin V production